MERKYKPCESAKGGIHKFDQTNHTRAAPCLFCGEHRDILVLLAEGPQPSKLQRTVELQIVGLREVEKDLHPERIAVVVSNRLTRDWYLRKRYAWKASEVCAEVIRQLSVTTV